MALHDDSTGERIATALERIAYMLESYFSSEPQVASVDKKTDLEFRLEMRYERNIPTATSRALLREVTSFSQLLEYIENNKLPEIYNLGFKGIEAITVAANEMKKEGVW